MLIEKVFETTQEKGVAAETALAQINKLAPEPVAAEDVYIGRAHLANDQVDRSHERFTPAVLERFAQTIVGKSVLPGHDKTQIPLGRWFGAQVEKQSDGTHHLVADFYLDAGSDIARRVKTGIAKDVSIGFYADKRLCGLCEKDYDAGGKDACSHIAGRDYNGQRATVVYGGDLAKYEAIEGSFVWLGCQYGAQAIGAKDAGPNSGFIVWKDEQPPAPPDKETSMPTVEELQKAVAERDDEVKALKAKNAELESLAVAGTAYIAHLKSEIGRKMTAAGVANAAMVVKTLENAPVETLKEWDEAAQKAFDEKFPPRPQSQMHGHGAENAPANDGQQPRTTGRFPKLVFGGNK